jgi:hypothetical protein
MLDGLLDLLLDEAGCKRFKRLTQEVVLRVADGELEGRPSQQCS